MLHFVTVLLGWRSALSRSATVGSRDPLTRSQAAFHRVAASVPACMCVCMHTCLNMHERGMLAGGGGPPLSTVLFHKFARIYKNTGAIEGENLEQKDGFKNCTKAPLKTPSITLSFIPLKGVFPSKMTQIRSSFSN